MFCRDKNQLSDHGLFPGRQRGDDGPGREEADARPAGRRLGARAVRGRDAPAQPRAAVPGPERDGAHRLRDAGDGRGPVDNGDADAPRAPVGETGTVADPARQPGVRETGARQRHAAGGDRRRRSGRPAAAADGARGPGAARRADGAVRAAHRGRHRRGGQRGGLVLRRPGQPLAGPSRVPARPRAGRRARVPVRPGLAAGPPVPGLRLRGRPARRPAPSAAARRRYTLVPADAVRHF